MLFQRLWVTNLLSSLKGNQLPRHHKSLWVQDLAQQICSRERPLLGGLLSTLPQWQSLTCSHEGSGFGSRRWTGLCVSLPCPWQHGLVWEGGQVCRKPYSEGVTMLQSPFHRKWQQEHKFKHQQHSLQGPAYHTLASSFEQLKLIVSDNRVKVQWTCLPEAFLIQLTTVKIGGSQRPPPHLELIELIHSTLKNSPCCWVVWRD